MSLTYVSQELNTYGGSVLLVIGTVGNAINIYIFSSVKTYRTTPCTFYFLIVSIHNIAYILINLPLRIISAVYNLDLTTNSEFWCKARNFLIAYLGLTSFTCSCLTTVDQFFATSRSVRLRRFNTIRLAYRLVFITIIIWCLHGIPVLIFYNTVPVTGHCSDINPTYVSYVSVYVLIFQCGIPGSVMVLFGCLTYRNIRLTRFLGEQHIDRQFVRMTSIQILLVVSSMGPFGCLTIYSLITSKMKKSNYQLQQESLAATVFIIVTYFYYVGNFYMFLISSSRFRQTVKNRLLCRSRQAQIVPIHQR